MNKRHLLLFLLLELLASVLAVVSFSQIPSRWTAAVLAGMGFVLLGLVIVAVAWRWADKYRSATFWVVQVHLWLMSVPMFVTRLLHEGDFSEATVLGVGSRLFHRLSEGVYLLLVLATVVDLIRVIKNKRPAE